MGVPWGIAAQLSKYSSREQFLQQWTGFAAGGFCQRFVVPYDDEFYTFTGTPDGGVTVTSEVRPDLLAELEALSCNDGTYDSFEVLIDAALFVPDDRGVRQITPEAWPWMGRCNVDSLTDLRRLKRGRTRLSRELGAAGRFAEAHDLMVAISY